MKRETRRSRAWVLLCVSAALLTIACRGASTEEVFVFAAASTTDALQEIAREYKGQTGAMVIFSFGSSSTLAKQIVAGAPADAFLSADVTQMDRLERAGLVRKEDRKVLLSNQMVVIVPASSSLNIAEPKDLANAQHVAVGDPESVPAGIYAKQWLDSVGMWLTIQPKIVPTLDVRAALAAVESGRAEAGIVYRTDAGISQNVRIAYAVPVETGPRIVYPVARLASSKKKSAAEFVDFLSGPGAKAIFVRHGFIAF